MQSSAQGRSGLWWLSSVRRHRQGPLAKAKAKARPQFDLSRRARASRVVRLSQELEPPPLAPVPVRSEGPVPIAHCPLAGSCGTCGTCGESRKTRSDAVITPWAPRRKWRLRAWRCTRDRQSKAVAPARPMRSASPLLHSFIPAIFLRTMRMLLSLGRWCRQSRWYPQATPPPPPITPRWTLSLMPAVLSRHSRVKSG
jgi:hypothetical protein